MPDGRGAAGGRKRRYRLRRYRKELHYLRPVTSEILQELEVRAPDSAGKAKEVICFAVGGHERADERERLAIVAFGHDDICHVVDLHYDRGRDVERIPHRIDLGWLKAMIARRRSRWKHQEGNDLAAQLLIRFVADINNKLPDRDHIGGAFLQFRDARQVAGPMPDRTPRHAVKSRLKRSLEAIMRTDPVMPSNQDVKVHIHFESDSTLADYDDLRCHLLGNGEVDLRQQGTFEIEKDLLTERFMALAWLAFDEFQLGDLVDRYLDRIGDGARAGGWDSDPETWDIPCRIPSARSRRRARSRFRKWFRRALVSFEQSHLEPAMSLLDGAVAGARDGETRRQKLAAWAERRWQTAKESRLLALHRGLDRERSDDEQFIKSCEDDVDKYWRLADAFRNFATFRGLGRSPFFTGNAPDHQTDRNAEER